MTSGTRTAPMRWYGEYLWTAEWPSDIPAVTPYRVCATDAAGNAACSGASGVSALRNESATTNTKTREEQIEAGFVPSCQP
jgi:hypothetical protein